MSKARIDFDEFVDRLKNTEPQLDDDLTSLIMDRLKPIHKARKTVLIDWIRVITSSAAAAFICLFMYLTFENREKSITRVQGVSFHQNDEKMQNVTVDDYLLHLQKNCEANERLENLKKQARL